MYMSDTGLLRRKSGVEARVLLEHSPHYDAFRGALTENYVQNQLICQGHHPYFWRSGNQAEVDFLIETDGQAIPIEVKAAENTRAKSYRLFCRRFDTKLGFKLSLKNRAVNEEAGTRTISLPLYLMHQMSQYTRQS